VKEVKVGDILLEENVEMVKLIVIVVIEETVVRLER